MQAAPSAPLTPWAAIAAVSLNGVIGTRGRIPWHLPDDLRFFKQLTTGNIVVMGRATFQAIGRPLPNRHTLVLSRAMRDPRELLNATPFQPSEGSGTFELITSPDQIDRPNDPRRVFICGGAQVYAALLHRCAELFLTRVRQAVEGDAWFPSFEHLFERAETLRETADFTIERWRRAASAPRGP
jgi:dihydrofolate reductase